MIDTQLLHQTVMDCITDPNPDQTAPEGAVLVRGILFGIVLKRAVLEEKRELYLSWLEELPASFFQPGGDSFLRLCMTKGGHQWGEHRNCEEMVLLGLGLGLARFPMPREAWPAFAAGGMPIVEFSKTPFPI